MSITQATGQPPSTIGQSVVAYLPMNEPEIITPVRDHHAGMITREEKESTLAPTQQTPENRGRTQLGKQLLLLQGKVSFPSLEGSVARQHRLRGRLPLASHGWVSNHQRDSWYENKSSSTWFEIPVVHVETASNRAHVDSPEGSLEQKDERLCSTTPCLDPRLAQEHPVVQILVARSEAVGKQTKDPLR